MKTAACLPLVACLLAAGVVPAQAQIYSWRDARGNLVLSDQLPAGSVRSYGTPSGSTRYRTTRPVETRLAPRYESLIAKHAATYDVPPDLVRAVVQVESGFDPRARSPRGALGLMQLMPATAIEMGVRDAFDPDENIRAGTAYLRQLLNRYAGDETLALAAYNAGPAAVDRHGYDIPFRETRNYVSEVRNRTNGTPTLRASRTPASPGNGSRVAAATSSDATPAVSQKPPAPPRRVYKTIEIIDGRPVTKYTDTKPRGPYELISPR